MNQERTPAIPLARAMLCLDCETIYPINGPCPACASLAGAPLARWLAEEVTRGESLSRYGNR